MKLSPRFFSRFLSAALGGVVLLSLTGCGDMLTWAADAKREGMQQYNDGRYAEAAGSFRNAARQDPTDAETEYWLGMSYEQTHSYHEAINAYKTALRLLPDRSSVKYSAQVHDQSFDRLARVVAGTDASNTETDLIVKTTAQSRNSEDYRLLGRIFRYRGDADTAMDNYHKAIQLDPDNFLAQKELGLYLETLDQNQEAAQVLRDAYRLNPNDQDVNNGLRHVGIVPSPSLMAQDRARAAVPMQSTEDELAPTPAASVSPPNYDNSASHN